MKKTSLLVIVLLLLVFSLSAGTNRIGAQVFAWSSDETMTIAGSSGSVLESGAGIVIVGSYYPSTDSTFGLGYLVGAASTNEATMGGVTVDVSDEPTTWLAGITGQYSADLSALLGLEVGAGFQYEFQSDSTTSSGVTTSVSISTLSFLGTANLLVNLSDSFSLIGGLGLAIPLATTYEATTGGISISPDVEITGSTLQAKVGVSFRI